MSFIPNEDINNIRQNSNIVDIISSYINLVPKGKNYFGICPFHNDHNPSMSVSEEKQIYTCFVCGASGNIFSFVADYENVGFKEAVKIVADKIGYNLNYTVNQDRPFKKYYDLTSLANKYFINNLKTASGKKALKYLKDERKISDEIINEFQIGLALNDNNLNKLLLNKGYSEKEIIECSLGSKSEILYDFFRNRIIFPILNDKGEVVAFSARIYNNETDSKYINSKESVIFKKGNILFNYDKCKNAVNKTNEVFLVEGHIDAIRIYEIGIKNVVATMGTALTKEHINLLKKLNSKVILMMDNDEAGEMSTLSIGEELINNQLNVEILRLSEYKDPDSYILNKGADAFKSLIKNPISYFEFKLNYLKKNKNLNKSDELAEYVNKIIEELNKSNDDILTEITLNEINTKYGIDKKILLSKIVKKEMVSKKVIINKPKPKLNKYKKACEAILNIMMSDVKYIKKYERDLSYIPDKTYKLIANDIIAFNKINKGFVLADFISYISDLSYRDEILRIINDNEGQVPLYEEFDNYVNLIDNWITELEIKRLINELKNESDINRKEELNDLIIKLKRGREE